MKFEVLCTEHNEEMPGKLKIRKFIYDNMTSEIFDESGKTLYDTMDEKYENKIFPAVSRETPSPKDDIRIIKIQLGLSCNYSCDYCSQRFVPHSEETSYKHVEKFIRNLDTWVKTPPKKIEFWGGEPLVYFKTLKPLAEALKEKYPEVEFLMITNGSLLTPEINNWLVDMNVGVGISHDGPGQKVRGPDPFDDIETQKNILDLYMKKKGNLSFNSMVHKKNMDRLAIAKFFIEKFGFDIRIGEGAFIDSYDEGGVEHAKCSQDELYAFRRLTMHQLRDGKLNNFSITFSRINEWLQSFKELRPAQVLGQKCGMDSIHAIAVDLRGNVLTCQNVSAVSSKDNGQQHLIGHVSNLENVKLDTATHWSHRDNCGKCPMLQLCKGSCMFLDDEKFQISCDTAYSDHLPYFCAAFEIATGCLPFVIKAEDDSLPEVRGDLWGQASKSFKLPDRD